MLQLGTRIRATSYKTQPPGRTVNAETTADAGQAPFYHGTAGFVANEIVAVGTIDLTTIFPIGQLIEIEGTNSNNGMFEVVGYNSAFHRLQTSPPAKNEADTLVTIRAP